MYSVNRKTTRRRRQNVNQDLLLFVIALLISVFTIAVADDTPFHRDERAATVVFVDQGNVLYDNGTLVFDAAINQDVEVYLLGNEDYGWGRIGARAAEWVRQGVLRVVPPSEVIGLLKKHLLAEEFDMTSTVKEVLIVEMPVVITSFMLLIMGFFIPIVGLIFCCCRCAGKCGGTRKEEDRKVIPMATTCILLIIVCLFIGTMSYLTNPSMMRMAGTVNHASDVANNILHDVETFKDNFIQDLTRLGINDLGFVTGAVNLKLDDVGEEVASPLIRETTIYITTLSDSVADLSVELTSFTSNGSALDTLIETSMTLVSLGQSLVEALDAARDNLTRIRDDCLTDIGGAPCDNIPDPSSLDTSGIDFSTISTGDFALTDVRNDMQTALSTIRDLIITGNDTLQEIPEMITNTSTESMSDIQNAVLTLEQVVEELVTSTNQSLNEMFNSLDFDSLKDRIDNTVKLPVKESVIDMISSLLPVVLSFMVIVTGIGLLIALIGLRCGNGPRNPGCGCDCGGKILMGSACWTFSIALFICIPGALFLIIGSTFTIVCDSLIDLSLIQEVVDDPVVWGGDALTSRFSFGNATFNSTVYEILESCQEDATLFDVLDLQSSGIFDIVLDLDIREMLPDLTSVYETVNDTVSALDVLPSDEANELLNQLTSQLSPSNITHEIMEMQSMLYQMPIKNLTDALNEGADAVSGPFPDLASDLRDLASDLMIINDQQLQPTINITGVLLQAVSSLNVSMENIEGRSEFVSLSVTNLADFVQHDAGALAIQSLEAFIESIISLADQFIDEVLRRVEDDMGRCGIVRNIYDALVGALCLYLLPGLNVFWFALSAISFALIPSIVFNVRFAKYLRRPTQSATRDPGKPVFNGVAVYPPNPSGTPESALQGSPLSMRERLSESLVNIRVPRSIADKLKRSGH